MAVFFEGSAKRCFDTTLRLGNQGCLTVLARIQVGWLFFLKNPVFHHQVSTMGRWAKFFYFPKFFLNNQRDHPMETAEMSRREVS